MVLIEGGTIKSSSSRTLPERLSTLFNDLTETLEQHNPDLVIVEELYAAYGHPRTAIQMAHARGVILLAAERMAIPVVGYPASEVKRMLTGSGRAGKAQVQRVVAQRLRLRHLPQPADVADALALALCHAARLRAPGSYARRGLAPRAQTSHRRT
jgi:crossover junction endodeoxyribonuclease RuvC